MQVSKTRKSTFLAIAAAAAVVALAPFSRAGTVLLPYSTGFEQTRDSNGDTYAPGNLVGQNGWINEGGESASGAAVVNTGVISCGQSVQLTEPGTAGNAGTFEDFYNSNLADHIGSLHNPAGSSLTASPVNVSFSMNHNLGTSGDMAGLEVLDGADNVIASLFAVTSSGVGNPYGPQDDINVYDAANNGIQADNYAVGVADGGNATYSINLDFNAETFTVFVNGTNDGTFTLGSNDGSIGAVTFAMYDAGNSAASATFDDLHVVPEPASAAFIAAGGLLMLGKRQKHPIA